MEQIKIIISSNFEYFIKIIFLSTFILKLNYEMLNIKEKSIRNIFVLLFVLFFINILCTVIQYISNSKIGMLFLDILIACLFSSKLNKNIGYSLLMTTISLCVNYIIFLCALTISYILFGFFSVHNEYLIFFANLIIFCIIFYGLCKIKKFKKGIAFFKDIENNEYLGMLILNIACVIFLSILIVNRVDEKVFLIYITLFAIIMFITIQKSLQLYYKQKLQDREVEEIKKELENKDKEIKELEKENLKLNKKNHSIAHKQKSLEYELEQMVQNNQVADGNYVKNKIENLSKEMQNETVSIELTKTGINEIDSMLKYMQSECVKNKIDFQLQVNGNIYHMVNTYIGKEDLEILIADLIKNAIIAINHSEIINKSILVRIGIIDGAYGLYVYDSGIEFEIETLNNLGIKPSTTHANDGGTGMGLMNTFDTLKKYKTSLIINEYGKPVKDNFTKVIKIIFDSKSEYKIVSYRKKKIQEKDINKRISYEL